MSANALRIALAQLNVTVGDIDGNAASITGWISDARDRGAAVAVFPELALCGYPPEDLLLRSDFLDACDRALSELAASVEGITVLVGHPERGGDRLFNSLAVLADREHLGSYRKMLLPNYGVFDEQRYFTPGETPAVIDAGPVRAGLTICEDVWRPGPPEAAEATAGADVILNASASPYHAGKAAQRQEEVLASRARETGLPIALCNLVGGQDELVFDGHSLVIAPDGSVLAVGASFEEDLVVWDLVVEEREKLPDPPGQGVSLLARADAPTVEATTGQRPSEDRPLDRAAEVYSALRLGLSDYASKNGFECVVFGLSGGIDSALVAVLAADALGQDAVRCISMPSVYSSEGTRSDAQEMASRIGVELIEIPIEDARSAYERALTDHFAGTEPGVAEENLQARIRGNLVMALSNKFGWLPLATGNKSEMSVGYATLYGDMAGGFAPIKDVPKTLVYELCEHRNAIGEGEVIPRSIIERPPSAELRPDQQDSDSLPPYDVLDPILEGYVERDLGRQELISEGLPAADVDRVIALVDRAEYKRRQAPIGVKITPKAFGRDRRMPITSRYSG